MDKCLDLENQKQALNDKMLTYQNNYIFKVKSISTISQLFFCLTA